MAQRQQFEKLSLLLGSKMHFSFSATVELDEI